MVQLDIEADVIGTHPDNDARAAVVQGIAADRLRSVIERIENLNAERKALGSDIKDMFAEAKATGFDPKVIRAVIKIRAQDSAAVAEQEDLLDTYRHALEM